MNSFTEMRDMFKEIVEILDQIIEVESREKTGEDVSEEFETLMGKFIVKMIKAKAIAND